MTYVKTLAERRQHLPHSEAGEGRQLAQAERLGSAAFRQDYGVKYAYSSGSMYQGIASRKLVVTMARARMMSFFGSGGLSLPLLQEAILGIRSDLNGESFGMNMLADYEFPEKEMRRIELFLAHDIRFIEAAAYIAITPALVLYRLRGIHLGKDQQLVIPHMLMAKVSRPEVAEVFANPAPPDVVAQLYAQGLLTPQEVELAPRVPMAQDICVESDSAGHTDQGNAYVLFPAIARLCRDISARQGYQKPLRVGAAGGIGTPEAVMAAFMLGADFIITGSVNQCSVEAATSDEVKDMLQHINIQDTDYAPAGDMFEQGAKVQVLRRGVFFPARANKLYQLYQQYNSLDELPLAIKNQLEGKYFKRPLSAVWEDVKQYYQARRPEMLEKIEGQPRRKMVAVFRWYFAYSSRLALAGDPENKVDYQVHCGPALGAFNQWVKGSAYEDWRNRHVDEIGEILMQEAASMLSAKISLLKSDVSPSYSYS
ncbi:PfaD family polyunsaturated fatty acid/polyketide biosynthesis protein [Serratia sp. root2]|uniref:PfaD family polyunsaturated fatty acid/polyketide biosynthesis protein n=1 Tax=Serratia sp. root2 TaxID=3059676 RepID=UPI00288F712E|nr:PfaD family polyunsaturated fatty acid/polyketide biosynthesis protein [Serratia sp. root2]MDT3250405.1 PfaD family polyunsaturated fatty acid/polyketide biosynthesis protein [Serratia sp. root2]